MNATDYVNNSNPNKNPETREDNLGSEMLRHRKGRRLKGFRDDLELELPQQDKTDSPFTWFCQQL